MKKYMRIVYTTEIKISASIFSIFKRFSRDLLVSM